MGRQKCILRICGSGKNIWKIAQARWATNENRWKRGLTEDYMCLMCGGRMNNVLHCICDCLHAKEIWNHMVPNFANLFFFFCRGFIRMDG